MKQIIPSKIRESVVPGFEEYPESLVKCLMDNNAAKPHIYSSEYYDKRKHTHLEFHPFVYAGKNFKKIISDVVCNVSSEVVFESIKGCMWSSISSIDDSSELNNLYATSTQDPVMFNFSVKVDGKKYGFSLRWDQYHVSEKQQFSRYTATDSVENRIKLLELAEEVRLMLQDTDYAKEMAIQDFIQMCRGKA